MRKKEPKTELIIINFMCEPSLIRKYDLIYRENGFSTRTQSILNHIRETVALYELRRKE